MRLLIILLLLLLTTTIAIAQEKEKTIQIPKYSTTVISKKGRIPNESDMEKIGTRVDKVFTIRTPSKPKAQAEITITGQDGTSFNFHTEGKFNAQGLIVGQWYQIYIETNCCEELFDLRVSRLKADIMLVVEDCDKL